MAWGPFFSSPRAVGMDLDDGAVQRHRLQLDADQLGALQVFEDPVEHPVLGPTIHTGVDRVPVPKALRQPSPLAPLLGDVQDRVEHLQIGHADIATLSREAGLDACVLRLGELHPANDITNRPIVLTGPNRGRFASPGQILPRCSRCVAQARGRIAQSGGWNATSPLAELPPAEGVAPVLPEDPRSDRLHTYCVGGGRERCVAAGPPKSSTGRGRSATARWCFGGPPTGRRLHVKQTAAVARTVRHRGGSARPSPPRSWGTGCRRREPRHPGCGTLPCRLAPTTYRLGARRRCRWISVVRSLGREYMTSYSADKAATGDRVITITPLGPSADLSHTRIRTSGLVYDHWIGGEKQDPLVPAPLEFDVPVPADMGSSSEPDWWMTALPLCAVIARFSMGLGRRMSS